MKHTLEEIEKMLSEAKEIPAQFFIHSEFAANSREIISDLVEEVKGYKKVAFQAQEMAKEISEENKRLREALEFYATNTYWVTAADDDNTNIEIDVGKVARKALEGK